jgi:hypothetical protein
MGVSYYGPNIYIKNIFKKKMNYENTNIATCKNIIFKKPSQRNQNASRYYNFRILISSTSQNIIFQKSSYKNRPIT